MVGRELTGRKGKVPSGMSQGRKGEGGGRLFVREKKKRSGPLRKFDLEVGPKRKDVIKRMNKESWNVA